MASFENCWLEDLSDVPPKELRLARLALNFHRATRQGDPHFASRLTHKALRYLTQPLVDELAPPPAAVRQRHRGVGNLDELGEPRNENDTDWAWMAAGMPEDLIDRVKAFDHQDPVSPLTELLCHSLQLNDVERQLLLFVDLLTASGALRNLCSEIANDTPPVNIQRLALLLELSAEAIQQALRPQGKLRRLALLKMGDHADLEDFLMRGEVLKQATEEDPSDEEALLSIFLEPLDTPETGLAEFPHLCDAADRLRQVLKRALETSALGVNALFYGGPGTGKTELARAVAEAVGCRAYSVRTANRSGEPLSRDGRLGGYQMAQILMADMSSRILVFDEIEDLQQTDNLLLAGLMGYAPSQDKGWFNRALETNPVPTIWITNDRTSLDPSALRRFLVPIEFRTPPRSVRRSIAARMFGAVGISNALMEEIAADVLMTPAALENARRTAELCADSDRDSVVRQSLAAFRQALHGRAALVKREAETTIAPALLNIEGVPDAADLIESLTISRQGRLCLYGAPGTGKTQFAERLAAALDRELIVATASSLLSPYLGGSEQNLAALFEQADPHHAVILIDEVDSFLRDRQSAHHHWQYSQVNELLQQMERFDGVFIAATNLMEGLDPAALRRFDLKLRFNPLTKAQRYQVFAQEVLKDAHANVPLTSQRLLDDLDGLTLGDIGNVRRQQAVLGEPDDPALFLKRLRAEWTLRQEGNAMADESIDP